MPYSYVLGDVVVPAEELDEKINLGELARYEEELQSDPGATIEFRNGIVSQAARPAGTGPLAHVPVGIGQPMSLEILGYYTGVLPHWIKRPSLLVSSTIKVLGEQNGEAKAVNQIVQKVKNYTFYQPSAEAEGSPVVLYSATLVPETQTIDFKLSTHSVKAKLFDHLARALKTASGLPLFFVPGPAGTGASTALLGASVGAELAGDLAEFLFGGDTFLRDTIELRFNTAGYGIVESASLYAFNERDRRELEEYEPTLVDGGTPQQYKVMRHRETKKDYEGPAPYIILNLDGRRRDDLANFEPLAATSAVLEQFFGGPDGGEQAVAIIEKAMGLWNDVRFREKALATQTELNDVNKAIAAMQHQGVDPADPAYQKKVSLRDGLDKQLQAYRGNIRQELFQLPNP